MRVQGGSSPSGARAALLAAALLAGACTPPRPVAPPAASSAPATPSTPGVVVPDLVGMARPRAIERVLGLGLNVRVVPLGVPRATARDDVARQVPLPGSSVPPGSELILAVYCRAAPCPAPRHGEVIYDPCTCATRT